MATLPGRRRGEDIPLDQTPIKNVNPLIDALWVFRKRGYYAQKADGFADAPLLEMGYTDDQVQSMFDLIEDMGWIDYGVSQRTGWLTDEGEAAWQAMPR